MRYRTNSPYWPIQGGARVVFGGTVIDTTALPLSGLNLVLNGVIPEPSVVPLDQPTHDWLVGIYGRWGFTIAPVGGSGG
jgi:hypothetical protein